MVWSYKGFGKVGANPIFFNIKGVKKYEKRSLYSLF